jgi:alkylation response protein AidB-like acyl-CoA dehydrogenase
MDSANRLNHPLAAPALDTALLSWLEAHAAALDQNAQLAPQVLPRLAAAGLLRVGVPAALGGAGGDVRDAAAAIAALAEHSMTAAFVLWSQRTFTEYLLQSPNAALRERLLPALLGGTLAGATGLSNAMKFLSGLEELTIEAAPSDADDANGWQLDGRLAWVTNLRPEGYVVAAAVARGAAQPASIFAIPHDAAGVTRSADLDLIALRGSNTAALRLDAVPLDAQWLLHGGAQAFCACVRPAFLVMQCGMPLGVARRSLAEAVRTVGAARGILAAEIETTSATLETLAARLAAGFADGAFHARPEQLFELRIELTALAGAAINLELQASGGRGYLRGLGLGFERRWLEAAFAPIVTPSSVQLRTQLAAHRAGANACGA